MQLFHEETWEENSFILQSLHDEQAHSPYNYELVNETGSICRTLMAKNVVLKIIILALNFTQIAGLLILSSNSESGRVLAESEVTRHVDDTVRVDPLDNLKKYRDGYNVTNTHYWSSTAFTGVYGYALAVISLLCGLGYGIFLLVRITCCKSCRKLKKRSLCNKQCYLQIFLLAIFFTLLAITACGLVLGGNSKFYSRAKMVINVIIGAADEASDTIYSTTGAMKEMSISLREVDGKATEFLTWTSEKLNSQAATIQTNASQNRHLIDKGLRMLYIITAVTISLSLVVSIALVAFGGLKFWRTLQIIIALCWIFTVLCWLFFGFYFFVQKIAADTCTALEGFQQDPYNNSLSSILPCDELLSAKPVLTDVSAGIYDLVNKVNQNISTSYGSILQICNPFTSPPMYEYQPWSCSATSIQIGDIPRVLRMLACPESQGICSGGILVPTSYYKTIEAYSYSIQKLLDAYPSMERLIQCQTVKDAFSQILQRHCKPLKRYLRMLWEALVFLSVVLMALVLIWTIGAHHEQNHHTMDGSVRPQSGYMLEFGRANLTDDDPNQ